MMGEPVGRQDRLFYEFDLADMVPADQERILGTLQEVAEMMGAEDLDAAPVLDVGPLVENSPSRSKR